MSKGYRYSDEFKQEAVNQVTIHGYAVVDVAEGPRPCHTTEVGAIAMAAL